MRVILESAVYIIILSVSKLSHVKGKLIRGHPKGTNPVYFCVQLKEKLHTFRMRYDLKPVAENGGDDNHRNS